MDEFYISCIWNFHTYSMSSQGFDVLHIARETRRDFIIEVRMLYIHLIDVLIIYSYCFAFVRYRYLEDSTRIYVRVSLYQISGSWLESYTQRTGNTFCSLKFSPSFSLCDELLAVLIVIFALLWIYSREAILKLCFHPLKSGDMMKKFTENF